jgi:poly [ADP-ribose] polymerase
MNIQYEPFGNHYFVGLKNRVDLLSDANGECQMRTYDFETGNVETQWLAPLAYWIHYWICQKKGMKEQDLSQEAAITADDLREYQTGNKQYNVQYPSKEYEDLYKLLHSFVNDAYQTIFSDSLYMTEDMIKQYPLLLGRLATSQSEEEFRDVLQEIFAMTPRKKPYNIWSISKEDFGAIIEEEYDNFNVLHSTFKASEGKPSTQKQKVNPMHVNITTPTQREIQLVERDMHANRNHLQYRKYTIYKVTSPAQDKAFKEYCARFKIDPDSTKETRYLWHGSRNANWESIITNHLMCKASSKLSGVTYTGSMFGDGIYLALEAQKSLGYASLPLSHWNSEHSNVGILGLYQCAYKNPIVCHRTHQYTEKFLKDKHSTCVHAYGKNLHPNEWSQLRNDEIIVFNPAAIALRYIVVFHS